MEKDQLNAIAYLRRRFEASGLTQIELAELAKIDHRALNRMLKGKRPIGPASLRKLAAFFKCKVSDFTKDSDDSGELYVPPPKGSLSLEEVAALLSSLSGASDIRIAVVMYLATQNEDYRVMASESAQLAERKLLARALIQFGEELDLKGTEPQR